MAAAAMTLPAPLQEIADLATHKARTQRVLNDLVPADAGERYDEGIDAEAEETYNEPERTQSAFRNFCDWCKTHCAQLQPYSNNWELAVETAPEGSLWRKNVEAYRDLLWKAKPGKPFAEFCSTRDTVMADSIFWPWVARTWRTAPKEVKDAFVAAASIRALSVAATWVEHLWEVDHPQCEDIRAGNIQPAKAKVESTKFGTTTVVGPLDTDHWYHRGAKPHMVTLTGWNITIHTRALGTPSSRFYIYDKFDRVFFRIHLPEGGIEAITPLLKATSTEPVKATTAPPRASRIPYLPSTRRFHTDLFDSVAARHGTRTGLEAMCRIIYRLREEGFINTEEDETAFLTEYRAWCRQ